MADTQEKNEKERLLDVVTDMAYDKLKDMSPEERERKLANLSEYAAGLEK